MLPPRPDGEPRISFEASPHSAVCPPPNAELSECLTIQNSPVLFGCRTGVCGTCLVEIEEASPPLPPPTADEVEILEAFAPGSGKARLACQLKVTGHLRLRYLGAHGRGSTV